MICATHKKVYPSTAVAGDALIGARIWFDYPPGAGPVSVYKCDECGGYHLTSKGPVNP